MNFEIFYDILQEDVNYEKLITPFLKYLNKDKEILDAGCGSGHILMYLLKLGYKTIGLDINSNMLKLASNKLFEANLPHNLFEHNLKKEIPFKFSQIISFLDVLNYFKHPKRIIKNLNNSLTNEGVLIFDIYKKPFTYEEIGNYGDIEYNWEIKEHKNKITHNIKFLHKDKTYKYKFRQYIKPIDYYLNILHKLNFKTEVKDGFDIRKHYIIAIKKS